MRRFCYLCVRVRTVAHVLTDTTAVQEVKTELDIEACTELNYALCTHIGSQTYEECTYSLLVND
jgi:hypothetical protein